MGLKPYIVFRASLGILKQNQAAKRIEKQDFRENLRTKVRSVCLSLRWYELFFNRQENGGDPCHFFLVESPSLSESNPIF